MRRHDASSVLTMRRRRSVGRSFDGTGESRPRNSESESSVRQRDISYTSIVLWVETIRIPRAEGCGPPGGADVCNRGYHFNMLSMNLEIREQ